MAGRIHGIPQTRHALEAITRRVELASPLAVKAGGDAVASLMRRHAPRRTGRLAARIRTEVETFGDGAVAHVGSDVPYDPFVQGGTVYMEPQAYGEEAAHDGAPAVVAAMAGVYKKALPT